MMQKLDIDPEEFLAWARGKPKQVAVPQPPPKGSTKSLSITVQSRDVIVLPAAIFSNVRSEP
jgi:hypothetical protein